jgi:hypothetical protein
MLRQPGPRQFDRRLTHHAELWLFLLLQQLIVGAEIGVVW